MSSYRKWLWCVALLLPAVSFAQEEAEEAAEEAPAAEEAAPADEAAPEEAAATDDASAETTDTVAVDDTAEPEPEGTPDTQLMVDAWFVPMADFETTEFNSSARDDGDGYGARAWFRMNLLVVAAEIGSSSYDGSGVDYEQMRGGLGIAPTPATALYVEYYQGEISQGADSADVDGYVPHGRVQFGGETLQFHGDLGYLFLEDEAGNDYRGPELTLGMTWAFSRSLAGLLDYRVSRYQDQGPGALEFEYRDWRLGGRFTFGL